MSESLFNEVAGLQVFSCEYCKIFKSSFFCGTPPVGASTDFLFYVIFSKRFLHLTMILKHLINFSKNDDEIYEEILV